MTPHRFDLTYPGRGTLLVRCGDLTADSERGLARKLVEDDAPDGPIQAGRQGKTDWTHHSLHRFAAGAVRANETDLHPALATAVEALRAERKAAAAAKKETV